MDGMDPTTECECGHSRGRHCQMKTLCFAIDRGHYCECKAFVPAAPPSSEPTGTL